ncbi:tyrosine-type recombinase/integrase [Shewanella sp. Actino-trap-3]|uniref:tyrosine-type recombinase/integrase n=1 Tax=Shewanella sp. Actino-trap-3 TaxID=2058331 RepID=UPI0018E31283|nr:tyrosine-type recombinase/integrase [Shewanella sp. Actino-trap-3]
MAKTIKMNLVTVMTFHDNGKPKSLTKYDSGCDKHDSESALKQTLALEELSIKHRVNNDSTVENTGGMKLSEAIEAYKVWRSNHIPKGSKRRGLTEKAAATRYSNYQILLLILGDKPIKAITRANIKHAITIFANLPKRNINPYCKNRDVSVWVEAAKKIEIPEDDLVSTKTVKEAFKDFQSLFSTFLTSVIFELDTSPTERQKVEYESLPYACFSFDQMSSIVNYWKDQPESDYRWIILLGAYTGARRGEIFNLETSEIQFEDSCKRHCLFILDGKNNNARRKIPIHINLINMGFLDFVTKRKANQGEKAKLFRDFKTAHYITDKFRSSFETISIPLLNDELRRFSFHSLRSAVITESLQFNELHMIQRVVGHEISNAPVTKKYAGVFEFKNVLDVIDCLKW